MVSRRRRIYWDACVWLSYINGYLSQVGDIHIVTSTVSQTEVAFALVEQNNQAPDPAVEKAIDALWQDTAAITLIEYHPVVTLDARSLIRMGLQYAWSLKPLDAIHLATARWFGVTEFHTYDDRLPRYSDHVGFPILEPYVSGLPPVSQAPLPEFDAPLN